MSFDEEGDHYMSKADFAQMCDGIKNLNAELAAKDAKIERLKEERNNYYAETQALALKIAVLLEELDKLLAERKERETQEPFCYCVPDAKEIMAERKITIVSPNPDELHRIPLYSAAPVPAVPEGYVLAPKEPT